MSRSGARAFVSKNLFAIVVATPLQQLSFLHVPEGLFRVAMKKVLLLGSGMCSKPIIDYLDGHGIDVVVGSRSKGDVKVSGTKHAKWVELDVEKPEGLAALDHWAAQVDAVVSLLPYVFHPVAAQAALKANKHFLTASYVSDGIRALEAEFKAKGLVTINECGVDPGTDHASMRAVVERVHAQGGKITYFTSFAGGLPAPGLRHVCCVVLLS